MSINYAIVGGDKRIIELSKMLSDDGNIVYVYGSDKAEEIKNSKNIICCDNLDKALENSKIVIGPIPFSSNGKDINTPFSDKIISIDYLLSKINNKIFIAGSIKKEVYNLVNNDTKMIDIMNQEELTILNVISTSEGAIEVAINNTDTILHGSNILIIGFGRIGKILSKKLEALSCNITCSARNIEDFAWIKAYGYKYIDTNTLGKNLSQFDIIINTVPHIILDKQKLEYVKKDCLLIDLASKPGGIDEQYAKQIGLKTIWALALPGKIAPKTTAKFIKNTIYHIIANGDGSFWQ